MKLILSILLSAALVHHVMAWETNNPPPKPSATICEAMIMIGCLAVAGYVILRVSGSVPGQHCPVTFILDKSTDGKATWVPICTNTVVLNGTNAIDFFREQMTDDMAFYRARYAKGYTPPK